jgi:hypothetical protein
VLRWPILRSAVLGRPMLRRPMLRDPVLGSAVLRSAVLRPAVLRPARLWRAIRPGRWGIVRILGVLRIVGILGSAHDRSVGEFSGIRVRTRALWNPHPGEDGPAMFERFSDLGRRAVVYAQEEARQLDHAVIASEHLLLGVLMTDSSGEGVLLAAPINLKLARAAVEKRGHMPFTPHAKRALDLAFRAAGDAEVGPAALLGGLVGADCGATDVLRSLGIDPELIAAAAPHPNEAEQTRPIRVRPKRREEPRDEH